MDMFKLFDHHCQIAQAHALIGIISEVYSNDSFGKIDECYYLAINRILHHTHWIVTEYEDIERASSESFPALARALSRIESLVFITAWGKRESLNHHALNTLHDIADIALKYRQFLQGTSDA